MEGMSDVQETSGVLLLNSVIGPLGPSPMSDTIYTFATITSTGTNHASVLSAFPEHPGVPAGHNE